MEITEQRLENVLIFSVRAREGERGSFNGFQQTIKDKLQGGDSKFIVNLSECQWIDSQGLGELVKALVAVMRQGGNLKLAAIPHRMQAILSITNLTQVFDIYATEAEAVKSFEV